MPQALLQYHVISASVNKNTTPQPPLLNFPFLYISFIHQLHLTGCLTLWTSHTTPAGATRVPAIPPRPHLVASTTNPIDLPPQ
jgi:hypothetical protein